MNLRSPFLCTTSMRDTDSSSSFSSKLVPLKTISLSLRSSSRVLVAPPKRARMPPPTTRRARAGAPKIPTSNQLGSAAVTARKVRKPSAPEPASSRRGVLESVRRLSAVIRMPVSSASERSPRSSTVERLMPAASSLDRSPRFWIAESRRFCSKTWMRLGAPLLACAAMREARARAAVTVRLTVATTPRAAPTRQATRSEAPLPTGAAARPGLLSCKEGGGPVLEREVPGETINARRQVPKTAPHKIADTKSLLRRAGGAIVLKIGGLKWGNAQGLKKLL
mmetsp:Transcript_65228/g.117391  ORF Transcript_65228/g.117391 Transcript_65228/m.117391 type:complete len:280 (-) Transcript_65228:31-870(-)